MKKLLLIAFALAFTSILAPAQQKLVEQPVQQEARAKGDAPKQAVTKAYDGAWSGETSQGKTISMLIKDGGLSSMTFAYKIPGRCIPVRVGDFAGEIPTLESEFDASWSDSERAPQIVNGRLRLENDLPGIFTVKVRYTLEATFSDKGELSATITFEPPQPCAKFTATWKATRKLA